MYCTPTNDTTAIYGELGPTETHADKTQLGRITAYDEEPGRVMISCPGFLEFTSHLIPSLSILKKKLELIFLDSKRNTENKRTVASPSAQQASTLVPG
jgi:hypothetical protein